MNQMFYECRKLIYINFKLLNLNSIENIDNTFYETPDNLLICSEKDNDNFQQFFPVKKIIYCDDSKENKYNCYMKNSNIYNNYTCDMCQNDFLFKYNESNVNVSFINCFEPNEILPNYNSCYYSCKTCEIEGN